MDWGLRSSTNPHPQSCWSAPKGDESRISAEGRGSLARVTNRGFTCSTGPSGDVLTFTFPNHNQKSSATRVEFHVPEKPRRS